MNLGSPKYTFLLPLVSSGSCAKFMYAVCVEVIEYKSGVSGSHLDHYFVLVVFSYLWSRSTGKSGKVHQWNWFQRVWVLWSET